MPNTSENISNDGQQPEDLQQPQKPFVMLYANYYGQWTELTIADVDAFLNDPKLGPLDKELTEALKKATIDHILFLHGIMSHSYRGAIIQRAGESDSFTTEEINSRLEPFKNGLKILGVDEPDVAIATEIKKRVDEYNFPGKYH